MQKKIFEKLFLDFYQCVIQIRHDVLSGLIWAKLFANLVLRISADNTSRQRVNVIV